MTYTKSYTNFTLAQDDRINITEVFSKGDTFDQMLVNCEIYAEDWHGNPVSLDLESIRDVDAAVIRADMAELFSAPILGNGGEEIREYPEVTND